MLNNFRLATRFLWREWRAGEWFIVFFALFFAVAAVTAIHFYTDRIMRGLEQQSSRLLGGDIVISSPAPISDNWRQKAIALELRTADAWIYPSMVSANNKLQLVNLEAVSSNFPLIGETSLQPKAGTVQIESRLLSLLSIKLNDNVTVGAAQFTAAGIITSDIDTLNTGWIFAPRLIMNLNDVPATRTVLPGSRINYRLLIAGDKDHLNQFIEWLKPQLTPDVRVITARDQQQILQTILQHTQDYLQLALIVCLIMSGVAISISIHQYLRRHLSHVALWRCLGAKENDILQIFLWQLLIMAISAGLIGIAAGFLMQTVIADIFKTILPFALPSASITPIFLGFMTSSLLLLTIAYPILIELPRISPLYLWRNEVIKNTRRGTLYFVISLLVFLLFIDWLMGFSLLTLFMIDVLLIAIGFFYALSLLLLFFIRRILHKTRGTILRGLSQLVQHSDSVSLQFMGFSLILTLLIVLGSVRSDLIANWQKSLPKLTPNYFAVNIAPSDIDNLKTLFQKNTISINNIYPMTKGRLVAINHRPVMDVVPEASRGNNALHRELNLSWMWQFPSDNKVVSGRPWPTTSTGKLFASVEEKLAANLQLHIGDQLTFQMGDKQISAEIINFRKVEWTSFHPNFFVIFTPGFLADFPTTYISSFYLNPSERNFLNQLVQQFPNITVIDIASILAEMQSLIEKMGLAIQYLFLFTLGAGILIFITSLSASMDERRFTYRLLRILGAGRNYIYKSIAVEFTSLGLLIILASIVLANIVIYLLMKNLFL